MGFALDEGCEQPIDPGAAFPSRAIVEKKTLYVPDFSLTELLEIDRRVMTPVDIEDRFRAPDGNVYHVDPIATRFGPLRPAVGLAGYRTPLDGLFLSGASTHPSAGICGVPGQQAAKAVLKSLRGHPFGRRR